MESEDDPAKLKEEIKRLHAALRTLVVEKNLMEHKLLRAFNKLLNTKKRKIRQLERELKKLKGQDADKSSSEDDVRNHCVTCRCSRNSRKLRGPTPSTKKSDGSRSTRPAQIDESGSDTEDPTGGRYSDETDVDDVPASSNAIANAAAVSATSPKKVVIKCHELCELSGVSSLDAQVSSSTDVEMADVEETKEPVPMQNEPKPGPSSKPEVQNVEKASSEDLNDLVDELCG